MIDDFQLTEENVLYFKKKLFLGNSLAVQWLGLCASTAGDTGSIPGRGTKILHAEQHAKKKMKKKVFLAELLVSHNKMLTKSQTTCPVENYL